MKKSKIENIVFLAALTIAAIAAIIAVTVHHSRPMETAAIADLTTPIVLLDAGHGGADGGALAADGTEEAGLNLQITLKTRDIMAFCGIPVKLTREDANSLDFNAERTIRENKSADIKARRALSESFPQSDFLSIHLNKYTQTKYKGAQVFYGLKNAKSPLLAEKLQESLRLCLDPGNKRQAKASPDSVYLMKNLSAPAVTVECGFLSNPEEAALLRDDAYQTKIAFAITAGYLEYIKER